jgi:hypothetical protein
MALLNRYVEERKTHVLCAPPVEGFERCTAGEGFPFRRKFEGFWSTKIGSELAFL